MAAKRADLVDAATDLNEVLDLDPEIDTSKSVEEIKRQIAEASTLLTDSDTLEAGTRAVVDEIAGKKPEAAKPPKGKKAAAPKKEKAAAPKKEKAEKAPRKPRRSTRKLGAFKSVRRGSSLHQIMEGAYNHMTVPQIAKKTNLREDQVRHRLRHVLGVNHGIDYEEADDGSLSLCLPDGKTITDAVSQPAA